MSEAQVSPSVALRRMINGFQVSQAIHVAATLGIADLLGGPPRSVVELAEATATDPAALRRLLRALAAVGVFAEHDDERFGMGPLGEHLRRDGQPSLAGWAVFAGSDATWRAWGSLLHSVRNGQSAFVAVHGVDSWEYHATHPDVGALFDRAMVSVTSQLSRALIDAYDFARFATVIDVGGAAEHSSPRSSPPARPRTACCSTSHRSSPAPRRCWRRPASRVDAPWSVATSSDENARWRSTSTCSSAAASPTSSSTRPRRRGA